MEKKVLVCDECKNRIAKRKCDICNSDICDETSCSTTTDFDGNFNRWSSESRRITLFKITYCCSCEKRLKNYSEHYGEASKRALLYDNILGFKDKFISAVRKIEMLGSLEDNKNVKAS